MIRFQPDLFIEGNVDKMEYIIIIIVSIITIVVLKIGFNVSIKNIKKIKQIGYDKKLNNIAEKFPSNKEICKEILKNLNNNNVKIEENNDSKASLYIAITNKIIIANIQDTFTRIQTIAHECLHSVQNRKTLIFNFIYSNIFILYFLVALFLILFDIGKSSIYVQIFIFMSVIYSVVRCYLENEAMSRALYVAKDYMNQQAEKNERIKKEDIDLLVQNFENINKMGIPLTNFSIIVGNILKIIILSLIALI